MGGSQFMTTQPWASVHSELRPFLFLNGNGRRARAACRAAPLSAPAKASLFRSLFVIMLLPFRLPHHVLRPRDRRRTITPLLLFGVLPEPVHAEMSEAKIAAITHFARVPGKELPQETPSSPVPVCPPPALADLHDAHSHPGFTVWQHSAHVQIPPVPHSAITSKIARIGQL